MGTMLDPKKNSFRDFSVKDKHGKVLEEPRVPMLIEELEKVRCGVIAVVAAW